MPNMMDRLPPHSIEAEQGVLGCVLLSPPECMPIALAKLRMNLEPFYDLRHQALYAVFIEMFDATMHIDTITLCQLLKDKNQLEALGGMPYVAGLMNCVPAAASIEYYIDILNEKAYLRNAIRVCTQVVSQIYGGDTTIENLVDELESRVMELTRKEDKKGTRKESLLKVVGMLEDMHSGREVEGLIKTGFPDLDKLLDGCYPGDQVIIAARPGLGKSTLAMNIAEFNAMECKKPVGYFSLEMSAEKLNMRSLASRTRIDLSIFRDGGRNVDYATHRISVALPAMCAAPLEIEFTPGITIMQLRARARQMVHSLGVKLLVVDMLQLVSGKSDKRTQEIGEVSRGLKALAGELGIPIISISSMNRDIEKSDNRRPRLSDLKESGDIESDADVVVFLWQTDPTSERDGKIETDLFIAKNRNGKTGEIKLMFMKNISRFESVSPVADVEI